MTDSSAYQERFAHFLCIAVCASLALLSAWNVANAATVASRLTIDGDVEKGFSRANLSQRRVGLSESGQAIRIDEFALAQRAPLGTRVAYATTPLFKSKLALLEQDVSAEKQVRASHSPSYDKADDRKPLPFLVVLHQDEHPPNHLFSPTPSVTFVTQRVTLGEVTERRGFAVVDVGETGSVLGVRLLNSNGVVHDRAVQMAISHGIRSDFVDERRHGHTVYLAYQVLGETISQVGNNLVTLPECDPPCY